MTNILFMGRKLVAAESLSWLCDRDDVRVIAVVTDSHLKVSPTRDIANKHGIPIVSREESERFVLEGKLQFDMAFSMLYWQRIREPILQACSKGVINFHPAPLPDYKGTAGYNVAILNGMDKWAVSAHYVDEGIDTGPLLAVRDFSIDADDETAQTLERKSQIMLLDLFKNIADKALTSSQRLETMPNIGGRYISKAEMLAMMELKPGDDVLRKIRAFWFPPYDGAYVMVNGIKCTLVSSEILKTLADPYASSLLTEKNLAHREI